MTTDPREMTPDELNREAATTVMGITPRRVRAFGMTETVLMYNDNPFFQDGQCGLPDLKQHAMPKSPATSIADAEQLLEPFDHGYTQLNNGRTETGIEWICRIMVPGVDVEGRANTRSKAITIAAIMAKREESK